MQKEKLKNSLTFRENKQNAGLVNNLKKLSEANNRRLNDYLNIILSNHIKEQNKTAKNGN
jgi:hypothetical protein